MSQVFNPFPPFRWHLTATRLRHKAQGCRFGYPGLNEFIDSNRNAVASLVNRLAELCNRFAVAKLLLRVPRVAETATLGFTP